MSSAAASPTLMALRSQACAPGPAPSETAVRTAVASGVTKVISTSRVPAEATASVRRCSGVAAVGAGVDGGESIRTGRTGGHLSTSGWLDYRTDGDVSASRFDVQTLMS